MYKGLHNTGESVWLISNFRGGHVGVTYGGRVPFQVTRRGRVTSTEETAATMRQGCVSGMKTKAQPEL